MSWHFTRWAARHFLVCVAIVATGAPSLPAAAQSTVSNLLAAFDVVDRVQCDVRRDTEAGARRGRMLSRVSFAKPDRLHVDNISPLPRRIVCDGTNFFSYVEGDPTGFSRPVPALDPDMLFGLRALPGTPMEHLLRLQGRPETNLPPAPGFTRCVRILGPPPQATLAFDAQGRLARLEIFDDPNSSQPMAVWDYSGFIEPAPGVWIPTLHKAVMRIGSGGARETSRFENYRVGATLDPSLFDPARHFRTVVFTNSFDAIYK